MKPRLLKVLSGAEDLKCPKCGAPLAVIVLGLMPDGRYNIPCPQCDHSIYFEQATTVAYTVTKKGKADE